MRYLSYKMSGKWTKHFREARSVPFVKIGPHLHHYDLSGSEGADTLVFINSLGTDFRIWDRVTALLPPGLRVLRYDKRGHGLSSPAGVSMEIDGYAADLAALMDHLKIGTATIVGLSIGGMIALSLSQNQPARVRSLILMDTAHRIGTDASWGDRMAKVSADGIEAIADGLMKVWFSPTYHQSHPHDIAGWRTMLSRCPIEGYLAACGAISRADLEPAARALQVSTLCVVGSTDGSTPPDLVRSLAAIVPGASFEEIPGPAHLPCIEAPAAVTDLILRHLKELPRAIDRFAVGMAVRRSVLGDAHVDRAEANKTSFDADFQTFITEGAWGTLWSRPNLTRRERSIVTLALLAALGHHEEVAMHARAARNTGATLADIREALMHVAVYAGVPAANTAIRIVKEAIAKEGAEGWDHRI